MLRCTLFLDQLLNPAFEAFVQILILNLSLNQTLLTFALSEANLGDSIASDKFSVIGYLPLIQKDSTHMHGLAVYVKGFLLHGTYLYKTLQILMFSTGFTSLSVLLLFPLEITFFAFMHSFRFYSIYHT